VPAASIARPDDPKRLRNRPEWITKTYLSVNGIPLGATSAYLSGASCLDIARKINIDGSRSQRGLPWDYGSIRRVLERAGAEMRPTSNALHGRVQALGTIAAVKAGNHKRELLRAKLLPAVLRMRDRGKTYAQVAASLNRRGEVTGRVRGFNMVFRQ
jgi:hypothetical protein